MQFTQRQKVAQLFFPAAFIHDSEENYSALERLIREEGVGGITFFHSRHSAAANFEKRAEALETTGTLEKMIDLINRYQKASRTPLLISIDGEYGLAMRIENTPQYPFAITLGALKSEAEEKVTEVGRRMGADLKQAGIHLNFAPCADINTNPNNPVIGYRSFGDERDLVSKLALAMYRGQKSAGIAACYKHFPGHGDTDVDSHLGLPVLHKTKAEMKSEELLPFQKGIDEGVEMIMVAHLAIPSLTDGKNTPASLSSRIIKDLLKKEMGFTGLVITDALNMKAVSTMYPVPGDLELEAFNAGNDLLSFSDHVSEGISKITALGDKSQIHDSFEKLQALKERLGLNDFKEVDIPIFDWEDHSAFQKKLATDYVSGVSGVINFDRIKRLSEEGKLGYRSFFGDLDNNFKTKLGLELVDPAKAELIILALFVPSHKPLNQFGMNKTQIDEIKRLAANKACILIHFGNPLALRYFGDLSAFEGVICGYQNFEEVKSRVIEILN